MFIALVCFVSLAIATAIDYCGNDTGTCVINTTFQEESIDIIFHGDVQILDGAVLKATGGSIHIKAYDGKITLDGAASVKAPVGIMFDATDIRMSGNPSIQHLASGASAVRSIREPGNSVAISSMCYSSIQAPTTGQIDTQGTLQLTAKSSIEITNIILRATGPVQLYAPQVKAAVGAKIVGKSDVTLGKPTGSQVQIIQTAQIFGNHTISVLGVRIAITDSALISSPSGTVTVGNSHNCSEDIRISGKDVSLEGKQLTFVCQDGSVILDNQSKLCALTENGKISINSESLSMGNTTVVNTAVLDVECTGNVDMSTQLLGWQKSINSDNQVFTSATIKTLQTVTLGPSSWNWLINSMLVISGSISVVDIRIRTNGSSCLNRPTGKADLCNLAEADVLSMFPPRYDADADITWDFAVVARDSLEIQNSHLYGASILLCSGNDSTINQNVVLDASGRGCPPGLGAGPGETRESWVHCGAGGGSHTGSGGQGAKYDSLQVTPCAMPGTVYDNNYTLLLPTQGASGGGCGLSGDKAICAASFPEAIQLSSRGGGLVWISAKSLTMHGNVQVLANGNQGISKTSSNDNASGADNPFVSGGGAGGQILLWAVKLVAEREHPTTLSVKGGDVQCGDTEVSGAGGGGFIGFHYSGNEDDDWKVDKDCFTVNIKGGTVPQDCSAYLPPEGKSVLYGEDGQKASLVSCPPGKSGLFCGPCVPGTWKGKEGNECMPCDDKPGVSKWIVLSAQDGDAGSNTSKCPYICTSGVPNIRLNSDCYSGFVYAYNFFGGWEGSIVLLVWLVIISGFLHWRHVKTRRKRQLLRTPLRLDASTCNFNRSQSAYGGSILLATRDRRPNAMSDLRFTKEQLPYHVCRVYLHGENTRRFPWRLSSKIPEVVSPLVPEEQWERFVADLAVAGAVPRRESYLEAVLSVLYPPLAPYYARWRRNRRVKRLGMCVQLFSEGTGGTIGFWKSIRARVSQTRECVMIFGCDKAATLGYLDFLDLSRSPLDWTPGDLHGEARLLFAHGHGSYTEPFEIDMGDPIVEHLAQTEFGLQILSVIVVFNRHSRLLNVDQLGAIESGGPQMRKLREQVEQCIFQLGLAGFIQVFMVTQQWVPLEAPPGRPSVNAGGGSNRPSFSDLLPQSAGSPRITSEHRLATIPGFWVGRGTHGSSVQGQSMHSDLHQEQGQTSYAGSRRAEVKLGLAFVDKQGLWETVGSIPSSFQNAPGPSPSFQHRSAPSRGPWPPPLTSPIDQAGLRELLYGDRAAMQAWGGHALDSIGENGPSSCLPTCPRGSLRDWGTRAPACVMIIVVVLLLIDVLVSVLAADMLFTISGLAAIVWIMAPPFVQLFTIVAGGAFLRTEVPYVGRLFAVFTILGIVNAVLSTLFMIMRLKQETLLFNCVQLFVVCSVKGALFIATNIHVGNLEATWDLSFLDRPQEDRTGGIVPCNQDDGIADGPFRQDLYTSHDMPVQNVSPKFPPPSSSLSTTDSVRGEDSRSQYASLGASFDRGAASKERSAESRSTSGSSAVRARSPPPLQSLQRLATTSGDNPGASKDPLLQAGQSEDGLATPQWPPTGPIPQAPSPF